MHDPLIGVQVGSYRITHMIGAGGMGRVYAAVQPEVGTRVAIKVLNEEYARDADLAERFFAEARAVNLIAHDNIVSVIDLVRLPDGRPVIVMELLEGETLRALIRGRQPPLGAVIHVMVEVLGAVGAAHAVGIIHRDLKPDNILVLSTGRAKVLDFGIAKLLNVDTGTAPRTRTGALVGTPEYMAPEQISGKAVDARTDVYASGIVLFEALTGRRPFEGDSDFEIMRAHVDQPAPSLRTLRPEIPHELEQVVLRALEKRPGDRYTSALEMANALVAASAALPDDEWRGFAATARAYARPAPLTAPDGHVPVPSLAPRASEAETVPAIPSARNDTVVSRSPRRTLVGIGGIAACAAAGVAIYVRREPTHDTGIVQIERHASYDAHHFDPVAFYPTALEMARSLIPDAQLMFFKTVPAHADGTIDLTQADKKQNVYLYRSATTASAPDGTRDCVGVEPYDGKVIAFRYPTTACDYPLVTAPPNCSLVELWQRAQALQPFTQDSVHIGFYGEDRGPAYWYVDPSLGRRTGAGVRVPDDCR